MSRPLIALVPTAVLVDGVRTVIAPGQPLPALPECDALALQKTQAAAPSAEPASKAAETPDAPAAPDAPPAESAAPAPPIATTAKKVPAKGKE